MKTALVIEDSEDNMVLITRLLKKAGYQTMHAETGLRGIEMASRGEADFIILDIQLPDINGTEVLRRLRESPSIRNIPIITMTSHAMAGDREKLLAAGCNEYIEKPIDPRTVVAQIQKVLEETL